MSSWKPARRWLRFPAPAALVLAFTAAVLGQSPPSVHWPGDVQGQGSLVVSAATPRMLDIFVEMASRVSRADATYPPTTTTDDLPYDSTNGDWHDVGNTRITTTMSSGGGRVTGAIVVAAVHDYTHLTDPARGGTTRSNAQGEFDVAACPDPSGVAAGNLSFALQQESAGRSGVQTGSTSALTGPFRLIDGEDAHLIRSELDAEIALGSHSSIAASDTAAEAGPEGWGVSFPIAFVFNRNGPVESTPGTPSGFGDVPANPSHEDPAMLLMQLTLNKIGEAAEEFWRSGNCITLTSTEPSRTVREGEHLPLTIDAAHAFDAQPVAAPIGATLEGVGSIAPSDARLDAPATFEFAAGHRPGDKSAITMKQTGKRGIGATTLEFTVARSRFEGTFTQVQTSSLGTRHTTTAKLRWSPEAGADTEVPHLPTFGDVPSVFYVPSDGEIAIEISMTLGSIAGVCTIEGSKTFAIAELPENALTNLSLELAEDGRYRLTLAMTSNFLQLKAKQKCRGRIVPLIGDNELVTAEADISIGRQAGRMSGTEIVGQLDQPIVTGVITTNGSWRFQKMAN